MKAKSGFPKRLFATVLSAVMALTTVPVIGIETAQAAVNTLTGVSETHWARNSIEKMVNQNILSGDKDGNLHPDRPVTRAEYVAMINRAFGYTDHSGKKLPFQDIKGTEWYADHIRVAYEQGYFSGIDKSTAGATNPITREEAAALICRNLKLDSKTLQIDKFADGKTVSQWSRPAVGAAVEKGFIHGYTDGSFRPKALISRAEAATMFSNAMGTIYDRSGTYGQGMIEGNVTISSSNLTLSDVIITGDLYITEGVGTGYVNLKNVSVLGEVIVCGGGEGNFGGNSVTLDDCTIWKLTVDGSDERPVSLYAKGNTNIPETNIKSIAYLQNHPDIEVGFDNIEVKGPEDTTLYLSGTFQNVAAMNPKNKVVLGKGKVENLTVDEDAKDAEVTLDRNVVVENMNLDGNGKVTGRGDIENLIVTTEDTSVESLPDQIEIRPGVTSNIGGKEMTSLDGAESSSDPKILSGYPRAEEITSSAAKIYFETNKPGSIRWALTYDDAEELDEDEILKPSTITRIKRYGSLNVDESEKEVSMALSGLEANATYILSAVLVDERGDVSRIKEEEIETADKTEPGFVNGYPRVVPETSTSFSIEAMLTKNGSIYWAVYKKGAAAPTAYQLRSQNLDGTLCHGVKKNAEKNIEYDDMLAMHESMTDKETYDVYVMTSDGEKDSKIVKLSATTKDTTPPEYNPEPRADKNEASAVSVTLGADEDVTAYYVVVQWDETFPMPVPEDKPNYPKPPALNSEFARRQVLNGNNVFKSGKANIKANTDTTIKISGLEKETPYHVFIVLQDKAGNYSNWVTTVDVKTRDMNPPVAKVDFENTIDGKADVEEDIMLVFDEIVCYLAPGTLLKGEEGEDPAKHLEALQTAEVFRLVDVSSTKEKDIEINYAPVTIDGKEILPIEFAEGEKGATIVIFHPEAFPQHNDDDDEDKVTGYGLNSGVSYKFILNHILDTTGNAMKKDYETEIFQTAPPLIVLEQTNELGNPKYADVDYAFTMTPEVQQTAPEILFDIVFGSDRDIDFELLIWDEKQDKFVQINNPDTDTAVGAGSYVTLHQMIDPLMDEKDNPTHGVIFEKFNQLEKREYAIRITRIDTQMETDRPGWNAIVKMDVKCVAGYGTQLLQIKDGKYAEAMSSGKASMVNYSTQNIKDSTEFIMEMSFSDTIVPKFLDGYPQLTYDATGVDTEIGDVFIRPWLMTDRRAKMYYVIVPAGTVGGFDWETEPVYKKDGVELEPGDPETVIGVPDHDQDNPLSIDKILPYAIISNTLKADIWGSYQIESGNMRYQIQLPVDKDLQPNKWYEMFCVLKGTPDTPSQVYYKAFKTKDIEPPVLNAQVTAKTETSATIQITSDKYAYIDWIVVPYANIKDNLVTDSAGQVVSPYKVKPDLQEELINFIRNGTIRPDLHHLEFSGKMTDLNVTASGSTYQVVVSTKRPLEPKTSYVLLAVGQMHLSNNGGPVGGDSEIVVSETFERKDTIPPEIDDPVGEQKLYTDINTSETEYFRVGQPYQGEVTIYFTEPLYYKKNDYTNPEALTAENFKTYFMSDLPSKYFTQEPVRLITEEKLGANNQTIKVVTGCVLDFKEVRDNLQFRLSGNLSDAEGNVMQRYYLIFHDEENTPLPGEPDFVDSETDAGKKIIAKRRAYSYWSFIEGGYENTAEEEE